MGEHEAEAGVSTADASPLRDRVRELLSDWQLTAPASQWDLASLEDKAIRLPDDLRAFYLMSNGGTSTDGKIIIHPVERLIGVTRRDYGRINRRCLQVASNGSDVGYLLDMREHTARYLEVGYQSDHIRHWADSFEELLSNLIAPPTERPALGALELESVRNSTRRVPKASQGRPGVVKELTAPGIWIAQKSVMSLDARHAITVDAAGVCLWDVENNAVLRKIESHNVGFTDPRFTRDGAAMVIVWGPPGEPFVDRPYEQRIDPGLRLLDLHSMTLRGGVPDTEARSGILAQDGTLGVLVEGYRSTTLVDFSAGRVIAELLHIMSSRPIAMAFSDDCSRLAMILPDEGKTPDGQVFAAGTAFIYASDGRLLARLSMPPRCITAEYLPDGRLAIIHRDAIRIWPAEMDAEARPLAIISPGCRWISGGCGVRGGEAFVVATEDGCLIELETATGRPVMRTCGRPVPMVSLSASSDGRYVLMISGGDAETGHMGATLWDLGTPEGRSQPPESKPARKPKAAAKAKAPALPPRPQASSQQELAEASALAEKLSKRNPPASEDLIAELAARSPVPLPADYLAFLRSSNGGGAAGEGVELFTVEDVLNHLENTYEMMPPKMLAIGGDRGPSWFVLRRRGDTTSVAQVDHATGERPKRLAATFTEFVLHTQAQHAKETARAKPVNGERGKG